MRRRGRKGDLGDLPEKSGEEVSGAFKRWAYCEHLQAKKSIDMRGRTTRIH